MSKQALILGASGLVGNELVRMLVRDTVYDRVTAIGRKTLSFSDAKLSQKIVDFEKLAEYASEFEADEVYCCLGTTIRKAGSQSAFKRVDLEYPVEAAGLAKLAGACRFLVISSLGADESSSMFYSRVKGEMERRLREAGLPELHIFRPSLLLGDRAEFRFGERAAAAVYKAAPFLFSGPLRRYRPVHARTVAAAMIEAARRSEAAGPEAAGREATGAATGAATGGTSGGTTGAAAGMEQAVFVYESDEIARLGATTNESPPRDDSEPPTRRKQRY